jgi:hypothetical protein
MRRLVCAALAWSAASVAICAGCSDATGINGPQGERLETHVSATTVHIGDSIAVTLEVTNPTFGSMTLVYGSHMTYAQVTAGNSTWGADVNPSPPDTIHLAAYAEATLRPVTLRVLPAGVYDVGGPTEPMNLPAGTYDLAACAWVGSDQTPEGYALVPFCAQSVTLIVRP